MSNTALDRFRQEFRRWVAAHNENHGFNAAPDELLASLESRIPGDSLAQIGSAYLNGWLATEAEPGRGYFVRETDRPGARGGQFTLIHRGDGTVQPCWELYVQLADYAWLRTVAGRYGQEVRLEDALMDLTVYAGPTLVLYVEHKTAKKSAEGLLQRLIEYGLFRVDYQDRNRFELHADDRAFASVLNDHRSHDNIAAPPWSPVDSFAIEVQRLCPTCWVSTGTGQSAFNFYAPGEATVLVVGVYQDGTLWSDLGKLGSERASRLRDALTRLDVELPTEKWSFWKRDGKNINVENVDPTAAAEAIRDALQVP